MTYGRTRAASQYFLISLSIAPLPLALVTENSLSAHPAAYISAVTTGMSVEPSTMTWA